MNDSGYSDERPAIEDDYDALFRPVEDHIAVEEQKPREWRLYTAEDGYEGVSSAMTFQGAEVFAASLRLAGVTVLRFVSQQGEIVDGGEAVSDRARAPMTDGDEDKDPPIDDDGDASADAVEPERPRKVIHVDMDAFFAAVEQRDDPTLRGRPVAVGGSRERGVVAAASYEARAFGVRSAMPSVTARRRCPDLVFVKPRFEVYKAVSLQIRALFAEHTALIEPLSLDEAYLDVTDNIQGIPLASEIALRIRTKILAETGLTASAGVSYNKFLAKLASDHRKPDGQYVITPAMGPAFVAGLPIGRFHGVGPATEAKMARLGIATGVDLRAKPLAFLQRHFGKAGAYFHGIARGIDHRPVRADRIRKSVGAENTFAADLHDYEPMREALQPILDKVWRHCEATGARGRTVTLKVKYADFTQVTRSRSDLGAVGSRAALEVAALKLLQSLLPVPKGVRLLGVGLSSLTGERPDGSQMTFEV